MKRLIKKVSAIALAATLAISTGMSAMAASDGSITVTNATKDETFSAYRILDAVVEDPVEIEGESRPEPKIAYTVNGDYREILTTAINALMPGTVGTGTDEEKDVEIMTYINALGDDTVRAFANTVREAIVNAAPQAEATATADENGEAKFTGLDYGYWLVVQTSTADGSASSLCMLDTAAKSVTIKSKSDTPSVEKKVKEETFTENDGYNDIADYDIGDAVPFKLTSTVPKMDGYTKYEYIFHDKMSDGLDFNPDSLMVYVNDAEHTTGFTLEHNANTNKHEFSVVFSNLLSTEGIKAGDEIRIEFTATLNGDAVIGLNGNTNEVVLEYSNDPHDESSKTETPIDKVVVFTFALDINKTDSGEGSEVIKLEGAEFELYRDIDGTDRIYVKPNNDGTYSVDLEYVPADADDKGLQLVSSTTSNIIIKGLDSGVYYLKETKAPEGYNLLTKMIKIELTAKYIDDRQNWVPDSTSLVKITTTIDGAVTEEQEVGTGLEQGTIHLRVVNNAGTLLPGTGGIGTKVFYATGTALMLAAAVYFAVTKKRTR